MELTTQWLLPFRGEGHAQESPLATLGLSAVIVSGAELIYVFSNAPFAPDSVAVQQLPQCLRELLLFEPLVAVRLCGGSFKSLRPEEWQEMISFKEPASAALHTLSCALESICSADLENGAGLEEDEGEGSSSEEGENGLGLEVDELDFDIDEESCGDEAQEDLLFQGSSS